MLAAVSMPQWPSGLSLGGEGFTLVCVRRTGIAVYAGRETYLRIGPGLEAERDMHQAMLDRGYPVPRLLASGEHDGTPYAVEESLGESTLGDLFDARRAAGEAIPETSFAVLTEVIHRLTRAQATSAEPVASPDRVGGFADVIGVQSAMSLTGLGARLNDAFDEAIERLSDLPVALLHGDLHESNVCERGVIDVEGSGLGPAGYDVTTAVFVPAMSAPPIGAGGPSRGWYAEAQVATYLAVVDGTFTAGGLMRVSEHLDEFLLFRAISLCAHRHRDDAVWRFRRGVLDTAVDAFERRCDVRTAVLGDRGPAG